MIMSIYGSDADMEYETKMDGNPIDIYENQIDQDQIRENHVDGTSTQDSFTWEFRGESLYIEFHDGKSEDSSSHAIIIPDGKRETINHVTWKKYVLAFDTLGQYSVKERRSVFKQLSDTCEKEEELDCHLCGSKESNMNRISHDTLLVKEGFTVGEFMWRYNNNAKPASVSSKLSNPKSMTTRSKKSLKLDTKSAEETKDDDKANIRKLRGSHSHRRKSARIEKNTADATMARIGIQQRSYDIEDTIHADSNYDDQSMESTNSSIESGNP